MKQREPARLREIARDLDELGSMRAKAARAAQLAKVAGSQPVMNYSITRMIRTASSCREAVEILMELAKAQEVQEADNDNEAENETRMG